jgi:hypothetical protein
MKLSELKAKADAQIQAYHETMNLITAKREYLLKKKQAKCPHIVVKKITEPGYFETGRMSGPAPDTVYRVCCKCKLKLSIQVEGERKFVPLNGNN